ncbi:rhamnosyltransferase [Catalinimonas alkaloidigena]|uniref:glycosyltransferase n=1 Tax=Catalinimonas alkaloidigena TaxID=1075417 RepID=UPI002405F9E7|nr:glycosyltransferase [Catalinimonas alkaloidigena]MDF9795207.1 rhamnosyltransferase [Catalinimonas alkaloidigena]
MMKKASIIIRSFNEEEHIAKLLSGILAQDYQNYEIILVDSGSTDATVSIAFHYPVKIISIRPEEFSFGYALNKGCAEASGEVLVFGSAHVYPVYTDWLRELVKPFNNDDVGLVYGKQRGNEQSQYSEHQVFAKWFPEVSDQNQLHPFCNNANAAIRRSLWQIIPYDESLTGLEDLDWARKVKAIGYKIVYSAKAEIIHVHQETPKKILNRYRREAMAMKQIIKESSFTFFDFINFLVYSIFHDMLHALHDRVFLKEFRNILMFRFMQYYGTYRGHKESKILNNELRQRFYYPKSFNLRRNDCNSLESTTTNLIDYSQLLSTKKESLYE